MKTAVNENGDRMSRADVCAGVLGLALGAAWLGLAAAAAAGREAAAVAAALLALAFVAAVAWAALRARKAVAL